MLAQGSLGKSLFSVVLLRSEMMGPKAEMMSVINIGIYDNKMLISPNTSPCCSGRPVSWAPDHHP